MIPWTTTPLGDTPWLLVIGKKGDGHFYYNTTTKESVWELPESLASCVTIDVIAPAMARARGYDNHQAIGSDFQGKSKQNDNDKQSLVKADKEELKESPEEAPESEVDEQLIGDEVTLLKTEIDLLLAQVVGETQTHDDDKDVVGEAQEAASGLVTGYSSSDDSANEEDEGAENDDVEPPLQPEAEPEPETNDHIDEAEAIQGFYELLDRLNADPYGEWLLFLESHIESLVVEPAYYAVPPDQHHQVFTQWAAQKLQQDASTANDETDLPPEIQYLEYLSDHKQEINKCASYAMFYNDYATDIDTFDVTKPQKTALYTKMYDMLRDFLKFSKQFKRDHPDQNAKVAYLDQFIKDLTDDDVAALVNDDNDDDDTDITWERVVRVLSPRITRHPINYIVGATKRAQRYESRRSGGGRRDAIGA